MTDSTDNLLQQRKQNNNNIKIFGHLVLAVRKIYSFCYINQFQNAAKLNINMMKLVAELFL